MIAKQLSGRRFGRLTVSDVVGRAHGRLVWRCACDCGNSIDVESTSLLSGNTRSCGCLHEDQIHAGLKLRHGHARAGQRTPTYRSWRSMMNRCYNPNATRYEQWGGRGIKVCEPWHVYENFLTDMGERPSGMSLDRYPDRDGDYEPSNTRWATSKQQRYNRRDSVEERRRA